MASTYSDLKIELIGTGEQSGTWGTTTNTNLGTALEEAIVGRATANFTSDADLTISLTNTNATQVARNYILNVTSGVSLSTTRNLIVPTIDKPYIVENNTTGSQSIVVKTGAGTGVTVPNGKKMMVYADSTNVVAAFNNLVSGTSIAGNTIVDTGSTQTLSNKTFVAPVLGTPTSGTLSSCTGLPVSTGISGLGTSVATALAVNVGTAGSFVVNGGALGTPSSGTLSSCTGLPISTGVSGLGAGVATFLATPTSANLRSVVSDESGTGNLLFQSGDLGTPTAGTLTNCTDLPLTGTTGTLAVNRGGTGQTSYTNGQLLIGNTTGNTLDKATLTAGANITITNGPGSITIEAASAPASFPAGTRMLFAQTAAPTGWTKDTTNYNNHALRVVTGTAATGGTVDFTVAFASQAVAGTVGNTTATNQAFTPTGSVSISAITGSAGATTLTTPQIPSHNHSAPSAFRLLGPSGPGSVYSTITSKVGDIVTSPTTANTGGGGSHTHPFSFTSGTASFTGSPGTVTQNAHNHTFTGTAINLAVKYLDVITATKN